MPRTPKAAPAASPSAAPAEPAAHTCPRYPTLTETDTALHCAIEVKAAELMALFERVKPGRYRALAVTALEEAGMWIVKEMTS